ncbi:MAG: ComEA family DNA-binding protein [Synergistaceae bacterium]|jgi:competence protein ComEA|nr:ComEA family DNA-binding protein [Synergistaceae bacterium]
MWRELWEEHRKGFLFAVGMACFLMAGLLTQLSPLHKESQERQERQEAPGKVEKAGRADRADKNASPEPSASLPQHRQNPSPPAAIEAAEETWFLYVSGSVRRPGVYKLAAGSRLFHLVEAAGGPDNFADLAALNMAAPLEDGVHVHVPKKGEILSENPAPAASFSAALTQQALPQRQNPSRPRSAPLKTVNGKVDVNRASQEELISLKGVGPVLAKNIVEHRLKNGRFRSVEDLLQVKGIGVKKLEGLRDSVILGP